MLQEKRVIGVIPSSLDVPKLQTLLYVRGVKGLASVAPTAHLSVAGGRRGVEVVVVAICILSPRDPFRNGQDMLRRNPIRHCKTQQWNKMSLG